MKLNLYSSNTTETAIKEIIYKLGENNKDFSSHIVIVPDRFALTMEKDIHSLLGLCGSFNIDVVSFSRLSYKLTSQSSMFLSKEGTVMLLKKVIDENIEKLIYYKNIASSIGFAKEMFAVIASISSSNISIEDFRASLKDMEENRRAKFSDILILCYEYEKALKNKYTDTNTRMELLAEKIKDNAWIKGSDIYILGFNMFSEKQISLMKKFLYNSKSLSIGYAEKSGGGNDNLFPKAQMSKFLDYAKGKGAEIEEKYFFTKLQSPFEIINKEMFSYGKQYKNIENKNDIRLFAEKDPYKELQVVAQEIVYYIKKGKRYKDISVVCCNDEYKKCIRDTFLRYDIPFFIDEKYPAIDSILGRFLTCLLETKLYSYRYDKVLNLIKHPFFSLEYNDTEDFENYILKYGINYEKFLHPFSINNNLIINNIREKLVFLTQKLLDKGYLHDIVDNIIEIIENYKVDINNINKDDYLYKASLASEKKIFDLLLETKEILGNELVSLEEFYNLFISGLAGNEISLLPQYLDCVFVGNTNESRFSDIDILFVVGANEGYFPNKFNEQTIVSLADFYELGEKGIKLQPSPFDQNNLEKFVVMDLLCKAKKLYVSCSYYSITGEAMLFGDAIKELSYIFDMEIENFSHKDFSIEQNTIYSLATKKNAFYQYATENFDKQYKKSIRDYLIRNGYENELKKFESHEQNDNTDYRDYFFSKDSKNYFYTKVSQLEAYFVCPYKHFLQYGLKLRRKEEAKLQVADIGNIIHEIMEVFFKENKSFLKDLTSEEIEEKARNAIEMVLSKEEICIFKENAFGKNTLNNIRNECKRVLKILVDNLQHSDFQPKYFELSFGMSEKGFDGIELKTDMGNFVLRGKIDRVDIFNNKVIIIDYKTGSIHEDLKYIFYGEKIQNYIYLDAFLMKGFEPAGVFYLPINDGYRKDNKNLYYKGQIENSLETITEIDKRFENTVKDAMGNTAGSSFLNVKGNYKKGGISLNPQVNKIDRCDFKNIVNYVLELTKNAIKEIAEGNIDKSPIDEDKICEYCQYNNFCDEENIIKRKNQAIRAEDFRSREKV